MRRELFGDGQADGFGSRGRAGGKIPRGVEKWTSVHSRTTSILITLPFSTAGKAAPECGGRIAGYRANQGAFLQFDFFVGIHQEPSGANRARFGAEHFPTPG
jgi:hypothetical protein